MSECNLKLVDRVLLFANASKSTRISTHGTRFCGVAQGLHIAIYIVQKHSYIYTWYQTLWSSSRPTYCYISSNYISSKSTRISTHGTRLCGVTQGLHIAIYYRPKALVGTKLCGVAQGLHIAIYHPTIYRPKALVYLHMAPDFVE